MCGRYYRQADKQRIAEAFRLGQLPDGLVLPPDFNVAPTAFWRSIGMLSQPLSRALE